MCGCICMVKMTSTYTNLADLYKKSIQGTSKNSVTLPQARDRSFLSCVPCVLPLFHLSSDTDLCHASLPRSARVPSITDLFPLAVPGT